MCGIYGYFGIDGKVSKEAILQLLMHRGPDHQEIKQFDNGFLAHTRLSIIDIDKRGHQPMATLDKKIWIVFNGEIYNYKDLKKQLSNYPFHTKTDTEVILAAYEKWGIHCLEHFRGMFSFAIFDFRENHIFCATDRFSIKPFYYYHTPSTFIFSSEIKPILKTLNQKSPNYDSIYRYLRWGALNDTPNTFFKDIRQLRPAHYFLFKEKKIYIQKYWNLTEQNNTFKLNQKETLEELQHKIDETFKLHMISDAKLGLSLSSGLDSNFILNWMAKHITPHNISCFTFSYKNTTYDEASLNKHIVKKFPKIQHWITPVLKGNILDELKNDVYWMEEPSLGLATHGAQQNYKTAKTKGFKVLLDGQGADEIFGGYQYYYQRHIYNLAKKNLHQARKHYEDFYKFHKKVDNIVPSFKAIVNNQAPFNYLQANDASAMDSDFLNLDFQKTFENQTKEISLPSPCPVKNSIYLDLFYFKIPRLLRYQDKCAMSQSIEVRVPFLDHTLVEYLYHIPTHVLLQQGTPKYLLRQLAKNTKLLSLLNEPKLYVSTPQREWVKASKDIIWDRLNHPSPHIKELINFNTLKKQFTEYCNSPSLKNSFFIWKYLNTDLWFENFI